MFRAVSYVVRNSKNIKNHQELQRCLSTQAKTKPASQESKPKTRENPAPNYSFVNNIFRGKVESSQVFPFPMHLNEEQIEYVDAFMDPLAKYFSEVHDAPRLDLEEKLDETTIQNLRDIGAFGLMVPQEYGGLELNNTQFGRLIEILGMNDLSTGVSLGAHQSIGYKGILLYGNKQQKEKYLAKCASGEVWAAFCLTEPSAGSDASSIKSRAVKSADGKHYILNGSKIWISNGGYAEIMTVFAQTEMTDANGQKKDKVTAFIVERGFGGVSSGPPEKKMGIRCSNTTEVYFEDVKIPIENVLGEEGDGFKVAMNILNSGRFGMSLTLAGTMRLCIQKATDHVTQRTQFGSKLENYGGIQEKIAKMACLQYVTQSMGFMVAGNMDNKSKDFHLEAAISKIFASESAWWVTDEAIQILGGMGYMRSSGLERFMRDLRIFRIFEGTNDILRLFVALTGIQYAGSHLKELQNAFKNPAANLGLIFKEASKRASSYMGLGGVDMTSLVEPSLKESAKLCAENIDMFSRAVESLLIKYGKNIIHEQFLLNRLADSVIDIFGMTCALSRASRSLKLNVPSAEHEKLLTDTFCVDANDRIRTNLRKIHNGDFNENYKRMSQISKSICENHDVLALSDYVLTLTVFPRKQRARALFEFTENLIFSKIFDFFSKTTRF